MPFEMDVHMAYHFSNAGAAGFANVGMIELISPATIISAIGSTEENDQAENDAREAAALMARIETDRMPCPRLCGATFSPGVGGLAGKF